jgi:HSP20 family protein
MNIRELIPWNRSRQAVSERRSDPDPVGALRSDINRAFEDFWRWFDVPMTGAPDNDESDTAQPRIDVRETDKAIEVVAELPGLDEGDVDVSICSGALTIRAEKESERETKDQDYLLRERSVGLIERMVPLPDGLDLDAAEASFRNGVLTVTIPKTAEGQASTKRIPVRQA